MSTDFDGNISDNDHDGSSDTISARPPGEIRGPVEFLDPRSASRRARAETASAAGTGGDTGDSDAEPRRGRGRKPGSKNKAKAAPLDINVVEQMLLNIHMVAAAATHNNDWSLTEPEAKALASGLKGVADQYEWVKSTGASMAWTNFVMVSSMIYIPRIMSSISKKKTATQQADAKTQANSPVYRANIHPQVQPLQ